MSNCRMPSLSIVIRFDVFKDARLILTSRAIPLAVNEFDFQCMQETLRHRIIIAVSRVRVIFESGVCGELKRRGVSG